MSDCLLFASLFATYAVLRNGTAGGAGGEELFSLPLVLLETFILLTSSFTSGLALLYARNHKRAQALVALGATFLLGSAFLALEFREFAHLLAEGHGWNQSAFLSAFFTLVGTHGLHVMLGLVWLGVLLIQLAQEGSQISSRMTTRLVCFSLFWHFLDIVWICIFSFVYLFAFLL